MMAVMPLVVLCDAYADLGTECPSPYQERCDWLCACVPVVFGKANCSRLAGSRCTLVGLPGHAQIASSSTTTGKAAMASRALRLTGLRRYSNEPTTLCHRARAKRHVCLLVRVDVYSPCSLVWARAGLPSLRIGWRLL